MFVKKIAYTDYDGNEREEEARFNLSKAELLEWELTTEGGMQNLLTKIVAEKDQVKIVEMFKKIILKSYGIKSPDGRRFIKVVDGHAVVDDFVQTEAYSELIMELLTSPEAASEFIRKIVPVIPEQNRAPALAPVK